MACISPRLSFGKSGGRRSGRVGMALTHVGYAGECDFSACVYFLVGQNGNDDFFESPIHQKVLTERETAKT